MYVYIYICMYLCICVYVYLRIYYMYDICITCMSFKSYEPVFVWCAILQQPIWLHIQCKLIGVPDV